MVYINNSPCIHIYNGYVTYKEKQFYFELNVAPYDIYIKWKDKQIENKEELEKEVMNFAKNFI